MCITFMMRRPDAVGSEWQLVVINNRDEAFDRPTNTADWHYENSVLCSTDALIPGEGTWIGINRRGSVGILLNTMELPKVAKYTRGHLVVDYLKGDLDAQTYMEQLEKRASHPDSYAGFTLVLAERRPADVGWKLMSYCPQSKLGIETLSNNFYGFGNSVRQKSFLKVKVGLKRFECVMSNHTKREEDDHELVEQLLSLLTSTDEHFPDPHLQSHGEHYEPESLKNLSRCFVNLQPVENYGTRTHTIIMIDANQRVFYLERNRNPLDASWTNKTFSFQLDAV